jgi:hypothetical protein
MSDGLIKISKSTWNINALTKVERMRIYDALAQCSTKKEREAVLRHIFPYHIPTVEPMFSKLLKSVNDVFGKHRSCPPADYKHECYKELKPAMNDFQQFLKDKRIISSDSGEPVRFTLKRRSPVTTTTPKPTTPTPVLATSISPHPSPLQPLNSNYIYWLPDWKIKRFAEMISERNTAEQKRFIQKYVHVTDEDGEPFIGLLNDIIADILYLSNYDDDLTTESKIKRIFDHLLHLKNTTYPEVIHVLYPFPAVYPDIFNRRRRIPTVRKLGGGGKTRRKLRRSRNRSLGMKMKGGLGPYDSMHIGMRERYSFINRGLVDKFKMYVFGSAEQRDSWETLLRACKEMKVVVYILSAGDKIGIIRMLQLMNLDDMFEEVLCTNQSENANPETYNRLHNFQGFRKYDVIRYILRERYNIPPEVSEPLTYDGAPNGCLMDDNPANDITEIPNKNIRFVNVNTVDQSPECPPEQKENMFYKFVANPILQLKSLITSRGLADVRQINAVTGGVLSGTYKIVFIDFDQTFQQYCGAIPFWRSDVIGAFHARFQIGVSYLYNLY